MSDGKIMPVKEFIALKEEINFEGFAGNFFNNLEEFETLVEKLDAAGLDMGRAVVQLLPPFNMEKQRLYSDVLFIPHEDKFSYEAVEAMVCARPDEFSLTPDGKFIRLWWD